ncbi:sigma 54-interacting transcriptional regulator [Thiomonas sp.]|uniref:sigma-54-dependent transcriptional regulator n=1 Tax=Thiomonas sp. TaxID=2047785 RepID=UPI00260C333C|nr:sigma 54-interacting transcriptional regulator [Thiomonas sp.]
MSESSASVLVVDDDADLLRLLDMRLRSAGYRPVLASSGEQALARLAVARPRAVITDLRMPGMDGQALFERIHESDPSLPVIILTAHGTIPDAVSAAQRGVFGYLTKPFESPELLDLLHRAMGEGAAGQPAAGEPRLAGIVTASPLMAALLDEVVLVGGSQANVLIQGESGTGKEMLARAVHEASPRRNGPFVAINCAAIPEALLESELFGHVKGAFTGADVARKGLFQSAQGGTVFLDEIGDMPVALQAKLLRVLQEREVRPLGSQQAVAVDVRIVSATHRDLELLIAEQSFREDLYYRLNVVNLHIPPLRERREDIAALAQHFVGTLGPKHGRHVVGFASDAMEVLMRYDWPGNVRQLMNVVEQCCALCTTVRIPAALVTRALRNKPVEILSYAEAKDRFERDYLIQLMKVTAGQVSEAARLAQRNRTEFYRLLQKHELSPALFKQTD